MDIKSQINLLIEPVFVIYDDNTIVLKSKNYYFRFKVDFNLFEVWDIETKKIIKPDFKNDIKDALIRKFDSPNSYLIHDSERQESTYLRNYILWLNDLEQ